MRWLGFKKGFSWRIPNPVWGSLTDETLPHDSFYFVAKKGVLRGGAQFSVLKSCSGKKMENGEIVRAVTGNYNKGEATL